MRSGIIVASTFYALLAGCGKQATLLEETNTSKSPGRFAGIGVFDAGRLWEQMAVSSPPDAKKDPAAATLQDDEHVIVVVDTRTGEVRQCGDHSGFCVAMNPWNGGPQNMLPAKMIKHAADLIAEQETALKRQQLADAKRQRK